MTGRSRAFPGQTHRTLTASQRAGRIHLNDEPLDEAYRHFMMRKQRLLHLRALLVLAQITVNDVRQLAFVGPFDELYLHLIRAPRRLERAFSEGGHRHANANGAERPKA